ncbi:MAG: hypothetical protein WB779_04455 [Ignavibacteriaceae bacterium]
MIGDTLLHFKILEKSGKPACASELGASAGRGGLVRPSWLGWQAETGRNRPNYNLGKIW